MNKKVTYKVWWYIDGLSYDNCIIKGHAEMLSLKRQLKRQGFEVKVERYDYYLIK